MVWLVQNCRSNKRLIPQTPELRGASPPGSLPELCLGPSEDHKRSPDPWPTHAPPPPPLTTNPGSAPDYPYYNRLLSSFSFSFRLKSNNIISEVKSPHPIKLASSNYSL